MKHSDWLHSPPGNPLNCPIKLQNSIDHLNDHCIISIYTRLRTEFNKSVKRNLKRGWRNQKLNTSTNFKWISNLLAWNDSLVLLIASALCNTKPQQSFQLTWRKRQLASHKHRGSSYYHHLHPTRPRHRKDRRPSISELTGWVWPTQAQNLVPNDKSPMVWINRNIFFR